eukprot:gb/GECG01001497.1/.p1 GENE.gb/GECG01001497.1/~~gb/GECG01001497.1/.p1  ORF type:complete len:670 (+),score=70.31 gb/GECG01001497.1/:1-2010(+)
MIVTVAGYFGMGLLVLLGLVLGVFLLFYGIFHFLLYKGRGKHPLHYSGDDHEGVERSQEQQVLYLPAILLADLIARKKYSSEEVTKLYMRQIEKVNPLINAVCSRRYENALEEARFCDECDKEGVYPEGGLANDSALNRQVPLHDQVSRRLVDGWVVERPRFWGVPCSVKECISLKGMPNTSGLFARKGCTASEDAPVVRRMRANGLIPLVNTNVSELCMWYESSNKVYGRTNNAYHTDRIVGGSSGGEAALISAAGASVGVGSDIGGSIRMPAHFNGIWGHKPSPGMIPANGQHPYSPTTLLSSGPLTRYAMDLWEMFTMMVPEDTESEPADTILKERGPEARRKYRYKVASQIRELSQMTLCEAVAKRMLQIGPDGMIENPTDSELWNDCIATQQRLPRQDMTPLIPILQSKLRIFTVRDLQANLPYLSSKVQSIIMKRMSDVLENLRTVINPKIQPQELELPELQDGFDIWAALMAENDPIPFRYWMEEGGKINNIAFEFIKSLWGASNFTTPGVGLAAIEEIPEKLSPARMKKMEELGQATRDRLASLLGACGILVIPVHPTVAPPHHVPLGRVHNIVLTGFFNAMEVPSTVVPLGLDKNGLPFAVQIIGSPGEDALTIAVATLLEQFCGNKYSRDVFDRYISCERGRIPQSPVEVGWVPPSMAR